MVEKTLDFFQIYYKEDHVKKLYDFSKPVYNQTLTAYFENSIIASLVPTSNADLISVASWRLKQKRSEIPSRKALNETGFELTEERILSSDFDVAILTPRLPEHKMLFMATHWHGRVWIDSFTLLASFLETLRIKIPAELDYPIYGNHFIAKGDIYREYVHSCLIPAIDFMDSQENAFTQASGYRGRKEMSGDANAIVDYEKASGLKDWPIGVFLLERLFSIWINDKNLQVINL